ncbi:MAG: hypothetical protein ACK5BE_05320 [Alphaproteobacteria bacterium]|jgi:hypothetical protein
MATEEQLSQALIRADAAGDTEGARILAAELSKVRAQSYVRPEIDAATENLDPRDVMARRRPAPATTIGGRLREEYYAGPVAGVVRGARDLIDKGAQALRRAVPDEIGSAIDVLGNKAADLGLPVAQSTGVQGVDENVRLGNNQYLYATGRREGELDLPRMIGNVAATTAILPARLLRGQTLFQRTAGGAALGGASGAMQPVFSGDFGEETTKGATVGAVAGAIGTPVAEGLVRLAVPVINTAVGTIRRVGSALRPQQYDNMLAQALEANGLKWADMPEAARSALREDVVRALQSGGQADAEAIRRLADLRAVGVTPTRGSVTLDPVQITAERNLAKIGANSTDPALQRLARVESENNAALIARLNQLQGGNPADEFSTGAKVIQALKDRDAQAAATVNRLYDQARSLAGGEIPLNGAQFVNNASRALDAEMKGAFLPGEIRGIVQGIGNGEIPFNISTAEQLRTTLATAQRGAQDGNVRRALSLVRDALENAQPMQSVTRGVGPAIPGAQAPTAQADEVLAAFNRARAAHRARMQLREESPALAAAIDDAEPDRFVRQFILGSGAKSTVADVAALRRSMAGSPEALDAVRGNIVNHLKSRALSGASDEIGTFSQSAYNKAVNEIGDRKLAAFFSPEEIAQLRQVGRVASYLQVQPKGSAVNNSNTASAALGALDRIVSRIPFGDAAIRTPMTNYLQQQQAQNALLQTIPVTGRDVIDESTRNALLGLSVPIGAAFGVAGAQ